MGLLQHGFLLELVFLVFFCRRHIGHWHRAARSEQITACRRSINLRDASSWRFREILAISRIFRLKRLRCAVLAVRKKGSKNQLEDQRNTSSSGIAPPIQATPHPSMLMLWELASIHDLASAPLCRIS
jgi:hypothetical protein